MAFASDSNEFDDFVTCPVCLSEFDSVVEIRKPKFLPCSHTLCLQCVKVFWSTKLLQCMVT